MATKKAAKKATKKATKQVRVVKKKAEVAERPPESLEVPEEFDDETGKYVRVIPAAQVEVKPPVTFDTLTDQAHSISPELSERISAERKSHDDERPPNVKLDVPEIISRAWESVKGKNDPPFHQCVPSHVEKFYSHGEQVLKGNSPMSGGTMLARFERKVSELMRGN